MNKCVVCERLRLQDKRYGPTVVMGTEEQTRQFAERDRDRDYLASLTHRCEKHKIILDNPA